MCLKGNLDGRVQKLIPRVPFHSGSNILERSFLFKGQAMKNFT